MTSATPRPEPRGKPIGNTELVDMLCTASPTLREARRLHTTSFGTLVPHIFMGEVLAFVGAHVKTMSPRATLRGHGELAAVLDSLELGMASGDRETRNVISMSFVSDAELEPFFERLKPMLGPKVRAQLQGK